MDNNFDKEKVLKMVAVVGLLCLFVGIATRIKQKSEVTLSDYAATHPVTESAEDATEDSGTDDAATDEAGKDAAATGEASEDSTQGETETMSQEEYDSFYYTVEASGTVIMHVLYYDSEHKVTKISFECSCENPDEALQLYYDLYKSEHEFKTATELYKYSEL